MSAPKHNQANADPWVLRFADRVSDGGDILDLACGNGRHTALFLERGHAVTAIDRDLSRLDPALRGADVETIEADLEAGSWPLDGRQFAGIVVVNYLYRPLFPHLVNALSEGGVLIYRTFQVGNEVYGRPSNPDFLLAEEELLTATRPLKVLAFESGYVEMPNPAVVQQICAIRRRVGPVR